VLRQKVVRWIPGWLVDEMAFIIIVFLMVIYYI